MDDSLPEPHHHSGHSKHDHHPPHLSPLEDDTPSDRIEVTVPKPYDEAPAAFMPAENPPEPPRPFIPSNNPLPPPPPVPAGPPPQTIAVDPDHPLAVAEVYSTYGIEYVLLYISLAGAAIGLGSLLNAIVDLATTKSGGLLGSFLNPYAEAALIVSFPIFVFLFLRLESKEEADPSLATDASRRRVMQIVLFISFIVILAGLITYIGQLLSGSSAAASAYGTADNSSGLAKFLHALIEITIAGGIFGFYWYKLHKKTGRKLP